MDKRQEAVEWATRWIKRALDSGRSPIFEPKDPDSAAVDFIKHMSMPNENDTPRARQILSPEYYESMRVSIVKKARKDPVFFRAAMELSAEYIKTGEALPDTLRSFMVDVLEDRIKKPIKKGPSRHERFMRNIIFFHLAMGLNQIYRDEFPFSRNEATSPGYCYIDIIVEAAANCGLYVGYDAVQKACKPPRAADLMGNKVPSYCLGYAYARWIHEKVETPKGPTRFDRLPPII